MLAILYELNMPTRSSIDLDPWWLPFVIVSLGSKYNTDFVFNGRLTQESLVHF